MIAIPYNEFFENPAQYQKKAEIFGIKILPKKKEKKISRRTQKKLDALNAVVGIIPKNSDVEKINAILDKIPENEQMQYCDAGLQTVREALKNDSW